MYLNEVLNVTEDDDNWSIYDLDKNKFEIIEKYIDEYDEGTIGTVYVIKEKSTSKFYQFTYVSNSWSEYDDSIFEIPVEEVEPVEVTAIKYVKVKK